MSKNEKIYGGIIIMLIIFVVILISYNYFSNYIIEKNEVENIYFERNFNLNNFETFLSKTDIYSKRNFGETLVTSFENNGYYKTIYGDVSIFENIKNNLDFIYGKNNYFLNINEKINSINLHILYDDFEFLEGLNNDYNFIQQIVDLNEFFNEHSIELKIYVYVISYETNSNFCVELQSEDSITCNTIDAEDLYDEISDPIIEKYGEAPDNLEYFKTMYTPKDWASFLKKILGENLEGTEEIDPSVKELYVLFTTGITLGPPNTKFFRKDSLYLFNKLILELDNEDNECEITYRDGVNEAWGHYDNVCTSDAVRADALAAAEACDDDCDLQFPPPNDDAFYLCVETICDPLYFDTIDNHPDNQDCVNEKNNKLAQLSSEREQCYDNYVSEFEDISHGYSAYLYYCPYNDNFGASNLSFNNFYDFFLEKELTGIEFYPIKLSYPLTNLDPETKSKINAWRSWWDEWSEAPFENVSNYQNGNTNNWVIRDNNFQLGNNNIIGETNCLGTKNSQFHPETFTFYQEQLNRLVDFGGELIDMTTEPTQLSTFFEDLINEIIDRGTFTIGEKRNITNKNIFEKRQSVVSHSKKSNVVIYLEVYTDNSYEFDFSKLGFVPVINDFESTSTEVSFKLGNKYEIYQINVSNQKVYFDEIYKLKNTGYRYSITGEDISDISFPLEIKFIDINGVNMIEINESGKVINFTKGSLDCTDNNLVCLESGLLFPQCVINLLDIEFDEITYNPESYCFDYCSPYFRPVTGNNSHNYYNQCILNQLDVSIDTYNNNLDFCKNITNRDCVKN